MAVFFLFLLFILLIPGRAWAIIPQNYPGVYPHQIAHVFFLIALAFLIFAIRRMGLLKQKGWKHITWSAGLLLFWNVHTLIGHMIELRVPQEVFINRDNLFQSAIRLDRLTTNYLIYRVDNLILIPAIILLYAGIRWHLKALSRVESG